MNRWIAPEEARRRGYDPASIAFLARKEEANVEAMALIADVERVFGSPPRPAVTLHVARGRDDSPILSPEEERELADNDPEEDWREVSDEKIAGLRIPLLFWKTEGKRFYLPAFIRYHLREFTSSDYWAAPTACRDAAVLSVLSEEERGVVDRFLSLREV